jgi:hypothetical protein
MIGAPGEKRITARPSSTGRQREDRRNSTITGATDSIPVLAAAVVGESTLARRWATCRYLTITG